MSKLEELIAELCPDGVEYKELGDVVMIFDSQRKPVTKKDRIKGIYPYYGANGIQDYVSDYIFDGTFLLMGEDGSVINKDNTPVLTWATGKIWVNNHAHIMSEKSDLALLRFLYFYLSTVDVSSMVRGTPPKINQQQLRSIAIPLPPLPVQGEIVRILDNFTELTAELTAELSARKKQYKYYCQQAFKTNGQSEMVRIGDLGKWTGGMTPSMSNKAYWENGTIPWISSKDMKSSTLMDSQDHITKLAIEQTSAKILPANITTIVARSGILKHTLPVVYVPFCSTVNQDIKALIVRDDILPRYAYFVILAYSEDILRKTKKAGGTVDSLDVKAFMNYQVPLVPITEQHHIIALLESFDTLCNDLISGLPAEIEARRQQYEYYRNQLLSFPARANGETEVGA